MNQSLILKIVGVILCIEALCMAPSLLLSIACGGVDQRAFLYALLICGGVGVLLSLIRARNTRLQTRDGFVCVALCWIVLSVFGALPYFLSGSCGFVDAIFETVSGLTTTGASIFSSPSSLPRGLQLWRALTQWMGGMGILVLMLALLPKLSEGSVNLMKAESPGPISTKLRPRTGETARILYRIYITLTVAEALLLRIAGMPLFDALCTVFGTAGTGGFGIRNDSMGSYSPYIQNVCTVFMLLFGVNFTLHYMIVLRRLRAVALDEELRLYLGAVIGCTALIAWNIRSLYPTAGETIRHAAFQVASIITTTGFSTTDFDRWPVFSKTILLGLMVVGACAGSTGGGFKCGRILLAVKNMARSIRQQLYPQRVQVVRINRQVVGERVLGNVSAFLTAYALILAGSVLIVSLDGFSVETNLSAVLACFNNIGPGLDQVGPMCSFAGYGTVSKLVLIFDMLAGRLEIFPILALMAGSTWRKR